MLSFCKSRRDGCYGFLKKQNCWGITNFSLQHPLLGKKNSFFFNNDLLEEKGSFLGVNPFCEHEHFWKVFQKRRDQSHGTGRSSSPCACSSDLNLGAKSSSSLKSQPFFGKTSFTYFLTSLQTPGSPKNVSKETEKIIHVHGFSSSLLLFSPAPGRRGF